MACWNRTSRSRWLVLRGLTAMLPLCMAVCAIVRMRAVSTPTSPSLAGMPKSALMCRTAAMAACAAWRWSNPEVCAPSACGDGGEFAGAGEPIELHDVGQQDGVEQPVMHVVVSADRMGHGVDIAEARLRKGDAGQHAGDEHVFGGD